MSLLSTKPRWHRGEIVATERGWVNPQNNEVLVAIGNLKKMLEAEESNAKPEAKVEPTKVEVEKVKENIKMEQPATKQKEQPTTRKPKVIGEVTKSKIPAGQQLIAEVVEYDLEKPVIGE